MAADIQITNEQDLLPPAYRDNIDILDRPNRLDKELSYRWVKVSKEGRNETLKTWKGWVPLTDMAKIKLFGFERMVNSRGRVQERDVELWYRPRAVNEAVKRHLDQVIARKSAAQREMLAAQAEEVKGMSKGRAIPFVTTSVPAADLVERTVGTAPAKGKEK